MTELLYRIGLAAERLGTSKHTLRRLWRAGLIQGTVTETGRLMIPGPEIARLEQEGVPPLPMETDDEDSVSADEPEKQGPARTEIKPHASDAVRQSFEAVTITQNHVQKRRLELEGEEVEDCFRTRQSRASEERSAEEAVDRERRSQAEAQRRQRDWEQHWHQYAVEYVTRGISGVPPEVKLEIPIHVGDALQKLNPGQPVHVVQALVDSAIEKALKPWRRDLEIKKVIDQAVERLPYGARNPWTPTKWQVRAKQAAYQAVKQLPTLATRAEIEAVARDAVEPIGQEFEHEEDCNRRTLALHVDGATHDELQEAKETVRCALLEMPVGAGPAEIRRVVEATLAPLVHRIALRQDQQLRESLIGGVSFPWDFPRDDKENALEAVRQTFEKLPVGTQRRALEDRRDKAVEPFLSRHKKREQKKKLIQAGLGEIFSYLLKLERDWEFDKGTWTLEAEIKSPIQQRLEKILTGDESTEHVVKLVRQLVRRELGLPKWE